MEIILLIELHNSKPIELTKLTKSLVSFASQYNKYASENGYPEANRTSQLIVNEIKSGSVILSLHEVSKQIAGIIALPETSTIIGFCKYFKEIVDFYKTGHGSIPKLNQSDLRDFNQILDPVATDNAAQYNILAKDNSQVFVQINISSPEANTIQNKANKQIEENKVISVSGLIHQKVLFYWDQAKRDMNAEKGNKGIIESISPKALNIYFDNEAIKSEMLHSVENPFLRAYEIDVVLQTIRNEPAVYKITQVYQTFALE